MSILSYNLNPSTPTMPSSMPENATLTVGSYASILVVAVASAWLCDLIISLPEEVDMIRKSRRSLPTFAYVFARVTAFGYLTCAGVMAVGQVNCEFLTRATDWFAALCLPATSMLFLLRVRAVFLHNRPVIVAFVMLWISTLGTLTQPFTIHRERTHANTSLCLTAVESFSTVGLIAVAVFDTAVFLAISVRLGVMSYLGTNDWKGRTKSFFTGGNIPLEGPVMSRVLLKTGQLYYLASIGVTLASTIVLLIPSVPDIVKCCVTLPSAAMQNAMACRVFRILRRMAAENQRSLIPDLDVHDPSPPRTSIMFNNPENKLATPVVCHVQSTGRESQLARAV